MKRSAAYPDPYAGEPGAAVEAAPTKPPTPKMRNPTFTLEGPPAEQMAGGLTLGQEITLTITGKVVAVSVPKSGGSEYDLPRVEIEVIDVDDGQAEPGGMMGEEDDAAAFDAAFAPTEEA